MQSIQSVKMHKRVAIMQPYFFPYFGYFQLIAAVDTFVIYDDTQFINRGWVNRNRILVNGNARWITLPLRKAQLQAQIRDRRFAENIAWHKDKILKAIRLSYARAPFFSHAFPVIESILNFSDDHVAQFNAHAIRTLCGYFGIATRMLISSEVGIGEQLSGKDRVIAIANGLHADMLINPIGGLNLYSSDEFMRHGLTLKFISTQPMAYRQFGDIHLENLSVIDLMMFVGLQEIREGLARYVLIDNSVGSRHRG